MDGPKGQFEAIAVDAFADDQGNWKARICAKIGEVARNVAVAPEDGQKIKAAVAAGDYPRVLAIGEVRTKQSVESFKDQQYVGTQFAVKPTAVRLGKAA